MSQAEVFPVPADFIPATGVDALAYRRMQAAASGPYAERWPPAHDETVCARFEWGPC